MIGSNGRLRFIFYRVIFFPGFMIALAAVAAVWADPTLAENCWSDVTVHGCAAGAWHTLQFRNNCAGGPRTVNVCVRWTSGTGAGQVNRLAGSAAGGQVVRMTPGLCSNGGIQYRYNLDGSVPSCPSGQPAKPRQSIEPCKGAGCGRGNAPISRRAQCFALMKDWNAKRQAYNTGPCSRRVIGSQVDIQCRQLKGTLLSERGSIARQCAGIIHVNPG